MLCNTIIIDKRKELSIKYKKALETSNSSVIIVNNMMNAFKFIQENEPDMIIISDSSSEPLEDFCNKIPINLQLEFLGICKCKFDDFIGHSSGHVLASSLCFQFLLNVHNEQSCLS